MKGILRKQFRSKNELILTKLNSNNYHSELRGNLLRILNSLGLPKDSQTLRIGSYVNKPNHEIIAPLIAQPNVKYSFPMFERNSRKMDFYEHSENSVYKMNEFGIKVPQTKNHSPTESLDVVLVPLLGFSINKFRLGKGGGYYDFLIRSHRTANSKTVFIGVAL